MASCSSGPAVSRLAIGLNRESNVVCFSVDGLCKGAAMGSTVVDAIVRAASIERFVVTVGVAAFKTVALSTASVARLFRHAKAIDAEPAPCGRNAGSRGRL